MDVLCWISAIFDKGDNFRYFSFAVLNTTPFFQKGGGGNNFNRVASLPRKCISSH